MSGDLLFRTAILNSIRLIKVCGERFIELDPIERPKSSYKTGGEVGFSKDRQSFSIRVNILYSSIDSNTAEKILEIAVTIEGDYSLPEPFQGTDAKFAEFAQDLGGLQLASHAVARLKGMLKELDSRHIPVMPLVWEKNIPARKAVPSSSKREVVRTARATKPKLKK